MDSILQRGKTTRSHRRKPKGNYRVTISAVRGFLAFGGGISPIIFSDLA